VASESLLLGCSKDVSATADAVLTDWSGDLFTVGSLGTFSAIAGKNKTRAVTDST
jgi:hypothetical protein